MTNLEKYENAFVKSFGVDKGSLAGLNYQAIVEWDSVGHMNLIAELEEAFDIMFETDDIIAFNSFEKGKELLKNYGVEV